MVEHEKFETGSNIYILTLTDYDPSGYIISQAVVEQVGKVARTIPKTGNVLYERLGLEPEQLTPEELTQNTYTPAPAGLKKWVKETGGVNGAALGLELDALPTSRIRALFVEGLRKVIRSEEPYHRDMARALIELLIWEAMEPKIEQMREQLWDGIGADRLIDELKCPEGTLAKFARAGASHINPLAYDKHIFRAADNIRELLGEGGKNGRLSGPL